MNKTDLLKPGSTRQNELHDLSRQINERENTLAMLRTKTLDCASAWVCEVMLQGQALLKAKSALTHGMWLDWLQIHCPLISSRTAQKYMLVASNAARQPALEIDQSVSLRSALALCIDPAQADQAKIETTKSWPPYLEALGRVAKFVGYVERFPLVQWPDEGREKLRNEFLTGAKQKWGSRSSPLRNSLFPLFPPVQFVLFRAPA